MMVGKIASGMVRFYVCCKPGEAGIHCGTWGAPDFLGSRLTGFVTINGKRRSAVLRKDTLISAQQQCWEWTIYPAFVGPRMPTANGRMSRPDNFASAELLEEMNGDGWWSNRWGRVSNQRGQQSQWVDLENGNMRSPPRMPHPSTCS